MLSEDAILREIKARPYYAVRCHPGRVAEFDIPRLKELIKTSSVSLRGWTLPHYDERTVVPAQKYIYDALSFGHHVEFWRMYRSGQFVYFGVPWDVAPDFQQQLRQEFDRTVVSVHTSQKQRVIGVLSFIGIIDYVTQIYVFIARLSKSVAAEGGSLEIALRKVNGWALSAGDPLIPWFGFYQCRIDDIRIKESDFDGLLVDPVERAALALKEVFECFSCDNSGAAIKARQEVLLSNRFVF